MAERQAVPPCPSQASQGHHGWLRTHSLKRSDDSGARARSCRPAKSRDGKLAAFPWLLQGADGHIYWRRRLRRVSRGKEGAEIDVQLLGRAGIQLMDVCDGHRTPPSILRASIPLHMHRSGQEGSNIATSPENIRNAPKNGVRHPVFPTDPTTTPSHTGAPVLCCAISPSPMSPQSRGAQQGPQPHTPLCYGFPASCEVREWGRSAYWCCSLPASTPAPAPA